MIKKRGNSWWVVVYAGRDPLTGKKRQKTGTAKTRAEARQLEAKLIREAGTGQYRAAGNKVDTATIDRFLAQLSERGRRCKHCQHPVRSLSDSGSTPLSM